MRLNDICKISVCAILIGVSMMACSDDVVCPDPIDSPVQTRSSVEEMDSTARLSFSDEMDLSEAISSSSDDIEGTSVNSPQRVQSISQANPKFVSLMAVRPVTDVSQPQLTYYEALGYDSLVPNPKFAQLLNTKGEVEVGGDVIKITPKGTYRFPKQYAEDCIAFISQNPNIEGQKIGEDSYQLNDKVTLIKTFQHNDADYSLISMGNYTDLPDDFFGDDDDDSDIPLMPSTRSSIPEPDFNSFQTFSADRKTFVGKLIQNIIGSTKASTVNFNKKRRVRGSFYFYNYGVYGEIGVKGWTDRKRKHWFGWTKVNCDELRVGWRNVILKLPLSSDLKKALSGNKDIGYLPPQNININGKIANTATLIMPEIPKDLKSKIIAQGVKAIYNYAKSKWGNKAKDLDKADACIIATPSELQFVANDDDIVKYNTKSYCHVFAKNFMYFNIGWSNTNGFFLNNVTQHNVSQLGSWLKMIIGLFNQQHITLTSGEVYVCARFGNEWRGMKIIKN